jgi:hypothetical protein
MDGYARGCGDVGHGRRLTTKHMKDTKF